MRVVEQIGKSIEEAKAQALQKLGVQSEDEVDIEVLDEGSKGVFGWGTKYARIRVKIKDHLAEDLEEKIQEILRLMNVKAQVEKVSDDGFIQLYNIYGEELGCIIGKKGQTLDALQLMVNLITNRGRDQIVKIVLDVEGYRERREKYLIDLAKRTALTVKRERKDVVLEPMMANERKIIHIALKTHPEVTTFSEGQDPLRRVVIAPSKGNHLRSPERGERTAQPVFRENVHFSSKKEGPLPPPPQFEAKDDLPADEEEK